MRSFGLLVARILLALIFVLAGTGKFLDYQGTEAYMASKGMTYIPFFLYAAATIELIGGLALIIGFKTRYAALLLILFLIPVTMIFHNFWDIADPNESREQLIHVLSNLAIMGGLLSLVASGPGRFSIDGYQEKDGR